eukprot:CAMPEP_0206434414 /NCGR_PEP_ID=MMETSP0324_2-20121206/9149_1 /ASSEMBLY_ACC=CAM_ASM_000836 /TAXON_ID=2866 /ORGANISM="Crypthecodinium cohnii, Strain Seligo" /LENGTH=70 /DNA_ID=CAMNT_0053900935 /DNA_START=579 /DNA_END=787 /DNA_ORIENTATION=-
MCWGSDAYRDGSKPACQWTTDDEHVADQEALAAAAAEAAAAPRGGRTNFGREAAIEEALSYDQDQDGGPP